MGWARGWDPGFHLGRVPCAFPKVNVPPWRSDPFSSVLEENLHGICSAHRSDDSFVKLAADPWHTSWSRCFGCREQIQHSDDTSDIGCDVWSGWCQVSKWRRFSGRYFWPCTSHLVAVRFGSIQIQLLNARPGCETLKMRTCFENRNIWMYLI